jgi:amidase
VRAALEPVRTVLEDLGCIVEDACPDLSDADEVFLTMRRWRTWHTLGPLLREHRANIKPEAIDEMEAGARVSGADVAAAMTRHAALMARMAAFQARYSYLVSTVSQVPPFEAEISWPRQINGVAMESYVSWMKSAYLVSATWCPAISVPAAFTSDGLPVGLQIVGRYREDASLLAFARAVEAACAVGKIRPTIARSA